MRTKLRLLPLSLLAAVVVVAAACGGDDSKAESKSGDRGASASAPAGQASGSSSSSSTSSSSSSQSSTQQSSTSQSSSQQSSSQQSSSSQSSGGRALSLDCGKELKSFKFAGKFSMQSPQASGAGAADFSSVLGSLLADVKFSGAYQSPDRTSFKLEGGKDSPIGTIEFIQIGNQQYTRFGPTGWQQSTATAGDSPTDNFDPRQICTDIQKSLNADVPTKKEKVNGVDATRYEYDKKALERVGGSGVFGDLTGGANDLPENVKLTVWVADKEKFPVKMTMTASGTQDGQRYAFDMELNVTDLNGNVSISAPR